MIDLTFLSDFERVIADCWRFDSPPPIHYIVETPF
jgi:hypothetical protein